MTELLAELERSLPVVVLRRDVPRLTGNMVAAGSLANHDSAGTGPSEIVRVGNRVGYPRRALVEWLAGRMRHECRRGAHV